MPKKRVYFKYEVPKPVVDIVRAVCADYYRRDKALKFSSVTGSVLSQYVRLNSAVEQALEPIEVQIRDTILDDFARGVGYNFSQASPFFAKNTYYNRKRKFVHDLAVNLYLI